MNRKEHLFKDLNFEERIKLRRELISEYGSSLLKPPDANPFNLRNKKISSSPSIRDLSDPNLFKGLNFDQRIKKRRELISKFGTSSPPKPRGIVKSKKCPMKQLKSKESFNSRIKKRRIINKLEFSGTLEKHKYIHILKNKEDYIESPHIKIDQSGEVSYISVNEKLDEREEIVFHPIPRMKRDIEAEDEFENYSGSFSQANNLATKLAKTSCFPVLFMPWNTKKQYFDASILKKTKKTQHILTYKDFFPVSKTLYRNYYYNFDGFQPGGNNLFLICLFLALIGVVSWILYNFNAPELWWGLSGCFITFLVLLNISLSFRKKYKLQFLRKRRIALKHTINGFNLTYLKSKHCHIILGPLASYLKIIFTHRAEVKTLDPNIHITTSKEFFNKKSSRPNSKLSNKLIISEDNQDDEIFHTPNEKNSTKQSEKFRGQGVVKGSQFIDSNQEQNVDHLDERNLVKLGTDNEFYDLPTLTTDVIGIIHRVPEFQEIRKKIQLDKNRASKLSNSIMNVDSMPQVESHRKNPHFISDFVELDFPTPVPIPS